MAYPIALLGLRDKRAQYVADLEHHQKEAQRAAKAIAALDAAMALWEEAAKLPPVRRRYRHDPGPFKRKECGNMVMRILGQSTEPMTTRQIADVIATAKGVDMADQKECARMYKRVGWTIANKQEIGAIRPVGEIGARLLWAVVPIGD